MIKKVLVFAGVLVASIGFAQTGSISIVSLPASIEAGETVTLQLTYTSDVEVTVTAQLFQTQEGSLNPDYDTYQAEFHSQNNAAGTDVPVSITFTVPVTTTPTASLTNRQYTFTFKLTSTTGATDFGWFNGTQDNIVEILAAPILIDNINFKTNPPTTAALGQTISFDFEFTLTETRNVKAGLAVYTTSGDYVRNAEVAGTEVAQYFSDEDETTTTPVTKTASILIPSGLETTAQLNANEVYRVAITIFTTDWVYITDKKVPITITATTDIANNTTQAVQAIPLSSGLAYRIRSEYSIDAITIYGIQGNVISTPVSISDTEAEISTAGLASGVYTIVVSTQKGITNLKIVK